MNIEMKKRTAIVREPGVLITSGPSAMELLASVRYETGCTAMVLFKERLDEGGFSGYTSKPLRDFIRESNQGRHVCFQPDEASALAWLERAGA